MMEIESWMEYIEITKRKKGRLEAQEVIRIDPCPVVHLHPTLNS